MKFFNGLHKKIKMDGTNKLLVGIFVSTSLMSRED
jgi:hypothetical protein